MSDLVVVGAGTMGAWTARRGQQAGLDVTLIDAYGAGNSRATSGDETRIIRSSYGPDELYATWAVEARDAWIELGRETGETLYVPCGTIWFAHHEDGFEATSAATLDEAGHPGRAPDAGRGRRALAADHVIGPAVRHLRARWRAADGAARGRGGRPPVRGGRRSLRARLGEAGSDRGSPALDVETGEGRHEAGTFVFAGGPWLPRLFPRLLGDLIKVTKQDVVYVGPSAGDGRFDAVAHALLHRLRRGVLRDPVRRRARLQARAGSLRPGLRPVDGRASRGPGVRPARPALPGGATPRTGRRTRRRDPHLPVRDDPGHPFHHRPAPRLRQRLDRRRRLGPRASSTAR